MDTITEEKIKTGLHTNLLHYSSFLLDLLLTSLLCFSDNKQEYLEHQRGEKDQG